MGFWEQIAIILVSTAVANIVSAIFFYLWRKRQGLPDDYAALKAAFDLQKAAFDSQKQMMERMFKEMEDRHKDFAVVQIQQSRDMVGLRGQIKYIQGIINGKWWKRADDAET